MFLGRPLPRSTDSERTRAPAAEVARCRHRSDGQKRPRRRRATARSVPRPNHGRLSGCPSCQAAYVRRWTIANYLSEVVPWPWRAGITLDAGPSGSRHGSDEAAIDPQERSGKYPRKRIVGQHFRCRSVDRGECSADRRRIPYQGRHDIERRAGQDHPHRLTDGGVVEEDAQPLRRERQRDPRRLTLRIDGAGIDAKRADRFAHDPNPPGRQETELGTVGPVVRSRHEGVSWAVGTKGKPEPRPAHGCGAITTSGASQSTRIALVIARKSAASSALVGRPQNQYPL